MAVKVVINTPSRLLKKNKENCGFTQWKSDRANLRVGALPGSLALTHTCPVPRKLVGITLQSAELCARFFYCRQERSTGKYKRQKSKTRASRKMYIWSKVPLQGEHYLGCLIFVLTCTKLIDESRVGVAVVTYLILNRNFTISLFF